MRERVDGSWIRREEERKRGMEDRREERREGRGLTAEDARTMDAGCWCRTDECSRRRASREEEEDVCSRLQDE